eukprot:5351555-Amphidinium_carterae.3
MCEAEGRVRCNGCVSLKMLIVWVKSSPSRNPFHNPDLAFNLVPVDRACMHDALALGCVNKDFLSFLVSYWHCMSA